MTSLPSASVLPTSTVIPLAAVSTSLGRNESGPIEFSTQPSSTRRRTFTPLAITILARPSALAAPPMSFFMFPIAAGGLTSSPPVSKHTPLPTIVTLGADSLPQHMSTTRGSRPGAAARPTA